MRNFQRVKVDVLLVRLINREYGVMERSQARHLLDTQPQNIMGFCRKVKIEPLNTVSVKILINGPFVYCPLSPEFSVLTVTSALFKKKLSF